jgi:hypothetical protein
MPRLVDSGAEGEEMTTADQYRLNAANCAQMAEAAESEPDRNRFKRMEAAWPALAEEQLARRREVVRKAALQLNCLPSGAAFAR